MSAETSEQRPVKGANEACEIARISRDTFWRLRKAKGHKGRLWWRNREAFLAWFEWLTAPEEPAKAPRKGRESKHEPSSAVDPRSVARSLGGG